MEGLEAVWRAESGKILATLIRLARGFEDAEEVLEEAFLSALEVWPRDGWPENPGAWLMTVAKRKLLDRKRVEQRRREIVSAWLPREGLRDTALLTAEPDALADDVLRLIFTCCHPALSEEARIALTLKTLGGLTTGEVARAFLVEEETMAQRLVRAKRKIAAAGVPYEVPEARERSERLASVLHVLYLIFNEGYSATGGAHLQRLDLAAEALRLAGVLFQAMPGEAEVEGLMALLVLTHARRFARVDGEGKLMTLDQQDRRLWPEAELAVGIGLVEQALRRKRLGPYQLQAAIAAVHAEAKTAEETDWGQIVCLYEELLRFDPSPVVRLNHAVAVAHAFCWEEALGLLEKLEGLDGYGPYHVARAQAFVQVGRPGLAQAAYRRAIELTANAASRAFLEQRLESTEGEGG